VDLSTFLSTLHLLHEIFRLKELRENEPNKGYKLFENGLLIPENRDKYQAIF
jgi:hypothetical protein